MKSLPYFYKMIRIMVFNTTFNIYELLINNLKGIEVLF